MNAMLILQSRDVFERLASLQPESNQVTWFARQPGMHYSIQGTIAEVGDYLCFLYRQDGVLHFRANDEDFILDEGVSVQLRDMIKDHKQLSIHRDDSQLFALEYRVPEPIPPLDQDPTPFVEEEDYDFCLFVYNVANSKNRRETIYHAQS